MPAVINRQMTLVEALATVSTTTTPRMARKNSRLLGPCELEIERAGSTGGGTTWGANLLGRGNALRQDLLADGVATVYDTTLPFVAFLNYNWLIKVDKSNRTGTAAVTAGSATVTGTGTAFTTELAIGDEITINGERKIVKDIASATSLTTTEVFAATATGQTVVLNEAILPVTTDVTVSNNGGFARLTFGAAGKAPLGAKIEVHYVTPVALDTFATATTTFRRRDVNGKDAMWYASDATASPSATNLYVKPIGE
jgi:hypothetical protein